MVSAETLDAAIEKVYVVVNGAVGSPSERRESHEHLAGSLLAISLLHVSEEVGVFALWGLSVYRRASEFELAPPTRSSHGFNARRGRDGWGLHAEVVRTEATYDDKVGPSDQRRCHQPDDVGGCSTADGEDEDAGDRQKIFGVFARSPPLAVHDDNCVKIVRVAAFAHPYTVDLAAS